MFVDYYSILEISEFATLDEIKAAFRKQAIKWHPDRNPGVDTTRQMQLINEANLILKDPEARIRFNKEYQKFKSYCQAKEQEETKTNQQDKKKQQQEKEKAASQKTKESEFEYQDYNVEDDILKQWIANAKRQAADLAKQTIKEFGGMVVVGAKEGVKAAGQTILIQIVIGIIFLIIFGLSKSCNS